MAWDVGIPQDDPCAIRHGPRLAALPQPAPVAGCQTCGRFVSARSTRAENSPYADTMPPLALPAILHLARPEERRHARGVRRGGEPRDARGPGLRADRPARRASHPDGATADPWIGRLPRAARGGPPTAHDRRHARHPHRLPVLLRGSSAGFTKTTLNGPVPCTWTIPSPFLPTQAKCGAFAGSMR